MKKKSLLFLVFFMFLIISFSSVFAYQLNSYDAKSKEDPLYLDMPDNMHQGFHYKIKVYINDPIIKKEADYLEISGGSEPYSINDHEIHVDSSGHFRRTIPYNGESVIEFGYRPFGTPGYTSSISVSFNKIKIPKGDEYPETHKPESEFYGYDCGHEKNDLFKEYGDQKYICYKIVGSVLREYAISYSKTSINLPFGYDFENNIKPNDAGLFTSIGESYDYYGKIDVENTNGDEMSRNEAYTISVDISSNPWGFEDKKESVENFNIKDYTEVNMISPPGGMTAGKAFERIDLKPFDENSEFDDISLSYQLYSQLDPVNSGLLKLEMYRKVSKEKGTGKNVPDKIISDAKQIASSFKLEKDKVYKPNKDLTHRFNIQSEIEQEEEEITEITVSGKIKDGLSNLMPYLKYKLKVKDKEFVGVTDENGAFSMPITDMEFKESETEIPVSIELDFTYNRNEKDYFKILAKNDNNHRYKFVNFNQKGFVIEDFENLEINIDFSKKLDTKKASSSTKLENLKHLSVIYFHSHETIDFFLEILKRDITHDIPIKIWIGNEDDATYYSPSSGVYICAADASITSPYRPDNREYHELSHYLMYDVYGGWPEDLNLRGTNNHDGFHNPSTADSYAEGFAEFMAMVISDHVGDKKPEIYAGFGTMEKDYKPWDARGFYEEFAVASLLWDMYDKVNEKGDSLSFTIEEMWKILKEKRANFNEYYKAFKEEYPDHSKQIDDVFIKHAFFADVREGNGEYDKGEPWRYTDSSQSKAVFIDLSNNTSNITYEENLTIGPAADYGRAKRTNAVMAPGSYLYTEENSVDFYKVLVTHEDKDLNFEYITQYADNKIYITPLPTGSNAQIELVPLSTKYTTKDPFIIESKKWNTLLSKKDNKGYLLKHDFKLEDTGNIEEYIYESYDGVKPNYNYKGDIGGDQDYKIDGEDDTNGKNPLIWILFIILVIGAFSYFYIKKPHFKYQVHKLAKTCFDRSKKSTHHIKTKIWPKIKRNSKKYSIKARLFIKKCYHKIKPVIIRYSKKLVKFFKDSKKRK